ncbi:hypothetical protein GF325_00185 [Candidatus Bathyarchaeota archaeon]|nr:hypothetical protein [Candidatus Bathyarchaeota archaeon]
MNREPGESSPNVSGKRNPEEPAQLGGTIEVDEWNRIGFHRPLGGFWFNYMLVLGTSVFAILFMFWLIPNFILPFPEAIGFQDIIKNLFAIYFMLADVGVGRAIQRFVAEHNIKNPLKALQYLQFFIWFQMFTGLIQVTIISIWGIGFVRRMDLAYATWFIIIYSTIQYPGMLGVFHGTLTGFQRFDKANTISFLQGVFLENTTRVVLILLGRWLGRMNPGMGELMGATIGSIIGAYLDDFIAAFISAIWIKPILAEINPEWRIRDMFGVKFDKALVKECTWFGIKAILPSTFHQANNFFQMILLINFLPNYGFIWGLFSLAEQISGVVGLFQFKMAATISEAYNNGKKALVRDYQARAYRWIGLSQGFLVVIILLAAPLLGIIAGAQFVLASPMIQVMVVGRIAEGPGSVNADIFMGCDKPEYYLVTNALEAIARAFTLYFLLAWFNAGWIALAMGRILGWWARWIAGIFLMRKLFKPSVNWWQTYIAPLLSALVEYLVLWSFLTFAYPPITDAIGTIPAAIIIVILSIFVLPFFLYFPVYAFLGGWDDATLEIFRHAVGISGPSKPFVGFIYRVTKKISRITPLHGRFPIDNEEANREIAELMEIRLKNRAGNTF